MRKMETGYACDIALEALVCLYDANRDFQRDRRKARGIPERPRAPMPAAHDARVNEDNIQTTPLMKKIREDGWGDLPEGESLIHQLARFGTAFGVVTHNWCETWEAYKRTMPSERWQLVEGVADKWGLRCDWGCGFILSTTAFKLRWDWGPGFILSANLFDPLAITSVPRDVTKLLTMELRADDSTKSLNEKLRDLKALARYVQRQTRSDLRKIDYRGYESHPKKDIRTQVCWLFYHITPPYLSADEIARESDVDQFYVARCYQKMAALLGIRLKKGWQKGRRRDLTLDLRAQIRAKMRPDI